MATEERPGSRPCEKARRCPAAALLLSVQILSAALCRTRGVIFSIPLTVVVIVLIQTLYLHDVLSEEVEVLGDHAPD